MGHANASYFSKTYIVCYRKMPKTSQKFRRFVSWHNSVKAKKNTPQKSNNIDSVPAASTAGPCPTIMHVICYSNITLTFFPIERVESGAV